MVSIPERFPEADGANLTLKEQLELGDRVAGQLLLCAKSPDTWTLLMLTATLPVLDSVTTWAVLVVPSGTLEKLRLAGLRATTAACATPLPVTATFWGLPGALSLIVNIPLRVPVAVGVNVRLITQEDAAEILAGQLLVCA